METEVLIIGGGPAGATCGSLLRQRGVDCLIVDHTDFPRDKVCGGGLTPRGWMLLERLLPGLEYDYHAVSHIRLLIEGKPACEFDARKELRIVQRSRFDHVLLSYFMAHGGQFLKGAPAAIDEHEDGSLTVTLKSGQQVNCRYLVGADGSSSFVRRHLTGNNDRGFIAREQYMERGAFDGTDDIVTDLIRHKGSGGYFYRFPNPLHDVVGYGDDHTTTKRYHEVMSSKHIPEGKMRGAYIYQSNDYPVREHIILIGDAGGFCNRLSGEGLHDAFLTASNAAQAIASGVPFAQTNRKVFRKKKLEGRIKRLFYSGTGFALLRLMSRWPRLVKWCFDHGVGPAA